MIATPRSLSLADVREGQELPVQEHRPTSRSLVRYTAAAGDYYEPHYDLEAAREANLPGVIVHGLLKAAWLTQAVTGWAGPDVVVVKVDVRYRGMDFVNDPYRVSGCVRAVDPQRARAEVEAWGENERGERTTTGVFHLQFFD